jgi:hypothetical protein
MRTRWNAKRAACVAAICAALAVGLVPSSGFAFGDGNSSGGTSNTAGSTSSAGSTSTAAGSTSTATGSRSARFYDAALNGANDCTGVGGTVGGSFGTATAKLATPSTVKIKVAHVSPGTTYSVIFDDSACLEHVLGTLVTDTRGRASGSYTFFATPYTGNGAFLLYNSNSNRYQTQEIAF